jgi:hypothetical protein
MPFEATPAAFLTVVLTAVALLLIGTVMGRYFLRRIAIGLAVIAVAAILFLDGRSPLG